MKKILSITLIIIITITMGINAYAKSDLEIEKSISKSYQYPVLPGTDEWEKFDGREEMVEACRIPEDILKNMSTEALVESTMSYPLLVYMYAYNTPKKGYEVLYEISDALQELSRRKNAIFYLEKYEQSLNNSKEKTFEKIELDKSSIDIISQGLMYGSEKSESARASISYVTTPKGSRVQAFYNLTWSDHNFTQAQAIVAQNELEGIHSKARRVSSMNPSYNCHSYAWHSTSTSNKYWINDPSLYMTDGSYESTNIYGAVIQHYEKGDHSARMYGDVTPPYIWTVISKWGALGVYVHPYNDSPYDSTSITFWR